MSLGDKPTKPIHIQIIRRWWLGQTKTEIEQELGVSHTMVENAINSDWGRSMLASLEGQTFDSLLEVQNLIQAHGVDLVRRKLDLALNSANPHVANKACSDLLGIAGHTPTLKVSISKGDSLLNEYRDKTELQIRQELLSIKQFGAPEGPSKNVAVNETGDNENECGPDGKPLN